MDDTRIITGRNVDGAAKHNWQDGHQVWVPRCSAIGSRLVGMSTDLTSKASKRCLTGSSAPRPVKKFAWEISALGERQA